MGSLNGFLEHMDWFQLFLLLIGAVACLFCITFHELAHGFAAYQLGDPTAKVNGRLTLNPISHIDWIGLMLLLTVRVGWAKPVPVDMRNFRHPKRDMAITALAGPVSNLLAALVGAVLVVVMEVFAPYNGVTQFIYNVLYYYVVVNISLAVFNLIPLPPLDGSRIVAAFLSNRAMYTYYRYQNVFVLVMFLLLFSGAMSGPLSTAQNFFARVIFSLAEAPFRLFGAL